jgi:hypothetical protein
MTAVSAWTWPPVKLCCFRPDRLPDEAQSSGYRSPRIGFDGALTLSGQIPRTIARQGAVSFGPLLTNSLLKLRFDQTEMIRPCL